MDAQAYFDLANELSIEQCERWERSKKTEKEFLQDSFEAAIMNAITAARKQGDDLLRTQHTLV